MLKRLTKNQISSDLDAFPAVAILGPRQVGKTTLAREIGGEIPGSIFLDLERPSDLSKLSEPEIYLKSKKDVLVCIDEIQLRPDLFPILRALIDDHRVAGRFLILGSSSPELLRQSSESLAGRIAYNYLTPLNDLEYFPGNGWQTHLWRGGFPDSLLADTDDLSWRWRENYIQSFLQRDVRQFGIDQSPEKLRRLWMMCAHAQGQVVNYSKMGQSVDLTHPSVSNYLDTLESTFMLRKLLPLEVNTKKRLVKSPKIYIRDTGLMCSLLQLDSFDQLFGHPAYGSCWEGFALEQILSIKIPRGQVGFFRAHSGEEIDLVVETKNGLVGYEFKTSSSPKLTKQNYKACELLGLEKLNVVVPEAEEHQIDSQGTTVIALHDLLSKAD